MRSSASRMISLIQGSLGRLTRSLWLALGLVWFTPVTFGRGKPVRLAFTNVRGREEARVLPA